MAIVRRGAELVAAVLFAAMFGTFLLQVLMRYVFNLPLQWSLEFDLIAYIWIVFWAGAFLLKPRDHISFSLIYDAANPQQKRVLSIAGTILLGGAFLAALPATYDFISFMAIESTPVIRWRFDIVFSVFLLFVLAVVIRSVWHLVCLARRDWRNHL